MTDNIVDLATERTQRRMLAERASDGADAFIDGLRLAGQTLANLAWLLAAPIRAHDRELTHGIYQLVLQRPGRIVDDAVAEGEWASWTVSTGMGQARDVAFAAFTAQMIALVETTSEGRHKSNKEGT